MNSSHCELPRAPAGAPPQPDDSPSREHASSGWGEAPISINRNRGGSMEIPGQTLLVCEVTPALFATVAANEAERAAPGVTLVDVSMIGVAGRIYMSGSTDDVLRAQRKIEAVLGAVQGREQSEG